MKKEATAVLTAAKKLWTNGPLWNALGSTMYGVNSLLLLVLVSRACGVETAGVFGISFTTAQLLFFVGLFGANHYQMTDYAGKYSFSAYARLKRLSSALAAACCALTVWLLGFTWEKAALTALLTLYMLAHSLGELYQSQMFQKGRLDLSGKSTFFRTLASFVCFTTVLALTRSVYAACAALLVSSVAGLWLWAARPARAFVSGLSAERLEVSRLARECAPIFLSVFLANLILNAPKYAIEYFWTDDVQGVFSMIFMPAPVINLMGGFLFMPLLSRISRVVEARDTGGLRGLMGRQALAVAGLTAICALGAWTVGPEALGLLYGTGLTAYRLPLVLVILGGGALAYCQLLYYVLVILRRQRLILRCHLAVGSVAVLLSVPLVSGQAVMGAAAAFVAAHALLLGMYLWVLARAWKEKLNA